MTDTKSKFKRTIHNKAFFFGGGERGVESHKLFKCFFFNCFFVVFWRKILMFIVLIVFVQKVLSFYFTAKKALAKGQRPLQHFVSMTRS